MTGLSDPRTPCCQPRPPPRGHPWSHKRQSPRPAPRHLHFRLDMHDMCGTRCHNDSFTLFQGCTMATTSTGDRLTAISVGISAIALMYSWSQDRALVRHAQANQVRTAAATTVAKLEHWRASSLSLFDSIQTALVDTSDYFVNACSRNLVYTARDYLYKELHTTRVAVQASIRDQNIETDYVYLGYRQSIPRDTLVELRRIEQQSFGDLLTIADRQVLDYLPPKGDEPCALAHLKPGESERPYRSADLGNVLRSEVNSVRLSFVEQVDAVLAPAVQALTALGSRSDAALVTRDPGRSAGRRRQRSRTTSG